MSLKDTRNEACLYPYITQVTNTCFYIYTFHTKHAIILRHWKMAGFELFEDEVVLC